jgi:type IV pilus assembly protein PilA
MDDRQPKNNQQGFSLIELIIVVLIIGIVAVIAIPNILSARRSANEGSAIATLRTLHGAQLTYKTTAGSGNYAGTESPTGDTAGLAALNAEGMIDSVMAAGTKSSYNYVGAITLGTSTTGATFFFSANPVSAAGAMKTGTRRYCITQQGVIGADTANLGVAFNSTTAPAAPPFNAY